jgi:hypothetical protein
MAKVVRLKEQDLLKLVKKIVSEQRENPANYKNHPINNKLWIELSDYVNGDGPEVMKYIPNKMLVISDGKTPLYTITQH